MTMIMTTKTGPQTSKAINRIPVAATITPTITDTIILMRMTILTVMVITAIPMA